MATQRVIPIEEDSYPAQVITIGSNYKPTPTTLEGCIIAGSGQQSVTFTNNSGATIDIHFGTNPVLGTVFTDIIGLANGTSSTQTPLVANGTANYHIKEGATVDNGPYAIQVGSGPMYIQFSDSSTAVITNPSPVAIPYGGKLEMVPAVAGDCYTVTWTGVDPFNPPITSADSTIHTEDISAVADYSYTVKYAGIPGSTGSGGGTVKVKGQ
jgi:hypothetical protein